MLRIKRYKHGSYHDLDHSLSVTEQRLYSGLLTKKFNNKSRLNLHIKKILNKNLSCTVCKDCKENTRI